MRAGCSPHTLQRWALSLEGLGTLGSTLHLFLVGEQMSTWREEGQGWTWGQLPPGRGQLHGQDEQRQWSRAPRAGSGPIAARRPEVAAPGVAGAPDTPVLQGEMPAGLAGPVG